ncbi:hypothetical protein PDK10_27170, partial [Bacillus cereus]|nr:hypothetical protein [Bacillus cereus]
ERRTVVSTSPQPAVGLTPVEIWNNGERVHFGNEITELRAETTKSTAPIDPNIAAKDAQRARLKAESPMRAAVDRSALPDSAAEASAAPISTDEHIAGFDRPDDKGATRQIDSLEHDARAMLAADPEATVVLGEGRAGQRLADVLVELDDDASSIEALRRCL